MESPVLYPKLIQIHWYKYKINFGIAEPRYILDVLKKCHQKELKASALDISASLPIVKPTQESEVYIYVSVQTRNIYRIKKNTEQLK